MIDNTINATRWWRSWTIRSRLDHLSLVVLVNDLSHGATVSQRLPMY
jgi:hypothetical protein